MKGVLGQSDNTFLPHTSISDWFITKKRAPVGYGARFGYIMTLEHRNIGVVTVSGAITTPTTPATTSIAAMVMTVLVRML